jgi:FkbM family methyltransferase
MAVTFTRLLKAAQSLDRFPEILRCQQHTDQWFRLTSAYIGLNGELPFGIRIPSGRFEFLEKSDVATFWQIFYRKIYSVRPSDRLIVDAGANIGAFSLYALQTAAQAKVIAIEPAPDSCQRLNSVLCGNGMASRYALFEVALGEHCGETTIQLNEGSQFRRTGLQGHRVAMMNLDSLIPENTCVDLLKMDIEGAEYSVLGSVSPATLRRIRRVTLEFHPQSPAKAAISPLLSNGFLLRHFREDGAGYGMASLERSEDHEGMSN